MACSLAFMVSSGYTASHEDTPATPPVHSTFVGIGAPLNCWLTVRVMTDQRSPGKRMATAARAFHALPTCATCKGCVSMLPRMIANHMLLRDSA